MPDYIETKTADLLAAAKRSGYFNEVIKDAEWFAADGYAWDVALDLACGYWCN